MFIVFLLLWIIFNGKFTFEICAIGFIVSIIMYAFLCKFMDYSIKKDISILKSVPSFIKYFCILIKEIVKANFATIKMITTNRYDVEPIIVHFKTGLKTNIAKVIIANSITLTPGTMTFSLDKDEFVVHCLDKDFSKGLDTSIFVTLLEKMERPFIEEG